MNISGSTINVTSSVKNTNCAVFAESYITGEGNKAVINFTGTNTINSSRANTVAGSADKNTYGLRAKGNAVVNGANNTTITVTDETGCTIVVRGAELEDDYTHQTGVIND